MKWLIQREWLIEADSIEDVEKWKAEHLHDDKVKLIQDAVEVQD